MFLHKGEQSGLDHSFSSMKDELLLCDDTLLPSRKIIGDRGGPASMKENICQVSFTQRSTSVLYTGSMLIFSKLKFESVLISDMMNFVCHCCTGV